MADGMHCTLIAGGAVTVTVIELDFVESCTDVAVMVKVPVAVELNTPEGVIVPAEADQVTC
jgi:hypothetical protein